MPERYTSHPEAGTIEEDEGGGAANHKAYDDNTAGNGMV